MEDKKELNEKELLKVTGGTEQSANGENPADPCRKHGSNKDSCKADPKCSWSPLAEAGCYTPKG